MRCDTRAYGVLFQEKLRCVSWWNNCYKYWYDIHIVKYIYWKKMTAYESVCVTPQSCLPHEVHDYPELRVHCELSGMAICLVRTSVCFGWSVHLGIVWTHFFWDTLYLMARTMRLKISIRGVNAQLLHAAVYLKFISKTNPDKSAVNLLLNPLSVYGDLPKPIVKKLRTLASESRGTCLRPTLCWRRPFGLSRRDFWWFIGFS